MLPIFGTGFVAWLGMTAGRLPLAALPAMVLAPALAQSAGPLAERTLHLASGERSYLLRVPGSYRRDHPAPLLLVFHGAGGRAQGIARHTGFEAVAESAGVVTVYPQGLHRRWNDGRGYGASQDDVGFIRALLDTLRHKLALDPGRIYATGISNGAMFAYRLACDLPGVFAAIAPVAGALPAELANTCSGTRPVAVIAFQGTADPLVPYNGGGVARRRGRGQVLSAERSVGFWAGLAGCAATPDTTTRPDRVSDGTRVRKQAFSGCKEGRDVVLYTIEGGGHTWPGGPAAAGPVGRVTRELDATRTIWDFLQHHPRQ